MLSLVAPHIMPFEIEDAVFAGESVQMTCHISKGDKPIDISWNFHGREMSSHLGITTTKMGDQTSFLSISSVMGSHSGNYTCIAKNDAGSSRYTAALHVKGNSNFSGVNILLFFHNLSHIPHRKFLQ